MAKLLLNAPWAPDMTHYKQQLLKEVHIFLIFCLPLVLSAINCLCDLQKNELAFPFFEFFDNSVENFLNPK